MQVSGPEVEQLCTTLPHPVASAYFAFNFQHAAGSVVERSDKVDVLRRAIFRYLAIICLSSYTQSQLSDPSVDSRFQELTGPTLGTWVAFTRLILRHYRKARQPFPIPELPDLCHQRVRSAAMLEAVSQIPRLATWEDYKAPGQLNILAFLEFLLKFRNEKEHWDLSVRSSMLNLLEPALHELVGSLRVLGSYPPVAFADWRFVDGRGLQAVYSLLQGDSPNARTGVAPWPVEKNPEKGHIFLCDWYDGAPRPLVRLFPAAWHAECGACHWPGFFLLNQLDVQKRRYLYVNSGCGHTMRRSVPDDAEDKGGWLGLTRQATQRDFRGDLSPPVTGENREQGIPLDLTWRMAIETIDPAMRRHVTRLAADHEVMHSGDGFQITAELNQDAYFCIVMRESQGGWNAIFPAQWAGNVEPFLLGGRQYRFPASEKWYRLDNNPGQETVYLIASPIPLDDLIAALSTDADPAAMPSEYGEASSSAGAPAEHANGRRTRSAGHPPSASLSIEDDATILKYAGSQAIIRRFQIDHLARSNRRSR
jgi:hypothetical protein